MQHISFVLKPGKCHQTLAYKLISKNIKNWQC